MDIYAKLREIGVELPPRPISGGNYSIVTIAKGFAFTSGQTPKENGVLIRKGRIGSDISEAEGYELVRRSTLNALAALESALEDLNRIEKIVKVTVFVSSSGDFFGQAKVANGCTDLLVKIFGEENGRPVRSAVGVAVLPGNAPCEVELQVSIRED